MITVGAVDRVSRLGPEWDPLFLSGPGLQSRRQWFDATERTALPEGAHPHVILVRDDGRPVAVLPMQTSGNRQIVSLTSPYTVLFQPLVVPDVDLALIGQALGRHLRRWPLVRLEAMDPAWPGLAPFLAGVRRAGMFTYRFDHFGNWHEDIAGRTWDAYLASRPGALRETVRRRSRTVEKDASIRFEVVDGSHGLDEAMLAYEAVYSRSWKVPEPYPSFNQALLPSAASLGVLRLAVMWQGETPLAAQYWTVDDGVATVLKLAHDDRAKSLSPGTVLTAHMIRRLLDEGVTSIDFGRGDDPYKALWTSVRQQRVGVMLAYPFRIDGLTEIVRHCAGQVSRLVRRGAPGAETAGRSAYLMSDMRKVSIC